MTGTIWQAILALHPDHTDVISQPSGKGESTTAQSSALVPRPLLPCTVGSGEDLFLDEQQRYQLLTPLPSSLPPQTVEIETKVLDCQPLKPALLEVLQEPFFGAASATASFAIPAIALPYLDLQEHCPFLPLPTVHDAWEQDGLSIVLLEDRTDLPRLVEIWQAEEVMPIQVLHWLMEMVDHWAALQAVQCCQSLLEPDNLRVDQEDRLLCLRRLYFDAPDQPPTLKDLGLLWQNLFEHSQRTQHGELFLLCRDLSADLVSSVEELRARIERIAAALQPVPVTTEMELNPFSDLPDSALMDPAIEAILGEADADAPTMELSPSEGPVERAEPTPITCLEPVLAPENGPVEALNPGLEAGQETTVGDFAVEDEEIMSEGDDQPTIVLPMKLLSIEDVGRTDTGRQRDHNEDCFYIQTNTQKAEGPQGRTLHAKGLYILCDGMGGHASGEVASALAVETLRQYFANHWQDKLPSEQLVREAILLANQAIFDRNQASASSGSGRMGTTLVLLLVHDAEAVIAHVGDSRLYRFSRRRGLEPVTIDHEVGQREIQRGVEPTIAYARPDAYQLTQALGPRDNNFVNPDIQFMELNEDMVLLLCSDGLSDNDLLEERYDTHLEPLLSSQMDLEQGFNRLIELANQFNGHDNITAIGIRVKVRPNLAHLQAK